MFLATTGLAEFWDKTDQILFLGPWCLLDEQKDQWLKLGHKLLPNPWDDREKLHQAAIYASEVSEQVLTELVAFLNSRHGVNFSKRYWRILLGPWLFNYVDVLYNYYVHLREAFNVCPEVKTWLLAEDAYQTPWDFLEYREMQQQGLYNLQLFSHLLSGLGYDFPKKQPGESRPGDEIQATGPDRSRLKNFVHKVEAALLKRRFPAKNEVVLLGANVDRRTRWKLGATRGFAVHYTSEKFPPSRPHRNQPALEGRQELSRLPAADPFHKILLTSLATNFPRAYLEDFQACRAWMLARYQGQRFPKAVINIGGLVAYEYGKFLAAEIAERGGKIVTAQHGGCYGWQRFMWVERHEREISDKFYCWGWAGLEPDPKLENLAAAKLSSPTRKRGGSPAGGRILLVGTAEPRYLNRFQFTPMGRQWENYLRDTLDFLQELGPQLQGEVLYRGFVTEYGWDMSQRVRSSFPKVTLDDHSRSFRAEMSRARLAVFDHPGTTFLEAIAANVPAVLFFDPGLWEMRASSAPYLEALRRVEILHETPASAARLVREVYPKVDEWWFSGPVQEVRDLVARRFALTDAHWNRQWLQTLGRELRAAGARP